MQWMTPVGRGFDSSFGFLGGSEDHFLHTTGGGLFGCNSNRTSRAVDLYRSNASGAEWCLDHVGDRHCSGTHGAYLFNAETQDIIAAHDASRPLFLYVATQDAHGPDQITAEYSELFNSSFTSDFAVYNGMVAAADDLYGNMTRALRAKDMYEKTLIILSADNVSARIISPLREGCLTDDGFGRVGRVARPSSTRAATARITGPVK